MTISTMWKRSLPLPLRLASLIALYAAPPSDAFAQANYCHVLWCLPYQVPASQGNTLDLYHLEDFSRAHRRESYSYGVNGSNDANITSGSGPALSLSNTFNISSFIIPYDYDLHSAEYSNSGSLTTASTSNRGFPVVYLSSIGRTGNDGSNGGTFHSGGYGDDGFHGAIFGFSNSGSIVSTGNGPDSALPQISPVGIFARSQGGEGGSGGSSSSVHHSGGGGNGAAGGEITISNEVQGSISTGGDGGHGIAAFSLGGGGGRAGNAKGDSAGRDGGIGGVGGSVTISNSGKILTAGAQAYGITAHSLGGTGGNGSSSGGGLLAGHSGSGGLGASGGSITITNSGSITTSGTASLGIYGVSTGGNGGDGASSHGFLYALGGSGGDGGNGGTVVVRQPGSIQTQGDRAAGIHVQSVGGGGGRGGDASSFGLFSSVAIGGTGGNGGHGQAVEVDLSGSVVTQGRDAAGIMAQSIGGGGGSAGDARAVSVGVGFSAAAAVGGSGGDGGSGGTVTVTTAAGSLISTGTAQVPTAGPQNGATTPVDPPLYSIKGHHSFGILAQSVGGGGGQGGRATTASVAVGGPDLPAAAASVAIGGSGKNAGDGSTVSVTNGGSITTFAAKSDGIVAQSVGGGGGSGGNTMSVAAAVAPLAITATVDLGGAAGGGGSGAGVTVTSSGSIRTLSGQSVGIVAQSIGGGGGSGGSVTSVEATLGKNAVNATVDLGGKGGAGGHGAAVSATNTGSITTIGQQSFGMLVQSVGGGGGHGGSVHDYSVSIATGSAEQKSGGTDVNATVNVGGKGGSGGQGQDATIVQSGSIFTAGDLAHGAVVQSIGGGGGSGGSVFSLSVGAAVAQSSQGGGDPGAKQLNATVSIGGNSGSGSSGGTVTFMAIAASNVTTLGDQAYGVLAQSVGGGGGNGGDAKSLSVTLVAPTDGTDVIDEAKKSIQGHAIGYVSGAFAKPAPSMGVPAKSLSASASVGGNGGHGNVGGAVNITLDTTSSIKTYGSQSHGVFAQSIGGGGGSGGAANTLSVAPIKTNTVLVTVGGAAGSGNKGGAVMLTDAVSASTAPPGKITTFGHGAAGIFAQSVGGGGGSGGVATDKAMSLPLVSGKSLTVSLGGKGGDGNDGGPVSVTRFATIETSGHNAVGIFAQSIGGGGGSGHYVGEGDAMGLLTLSMGGSGGSNGGGGGAVSVSNSGTITTHGPLGHAILAQSVGGGGGLTDLASSSVKPPGIPNGHAVATPKFTLSLGNPSGPSAGDGGAVKVGTIATLRTSGNHAHGVLAQSIAGGGGIVHAANAGNMVGADAAITSQSTESGTGGSVTVNARLPVLPFLQSESQIITTGIAAHAILAQSIGGGGGLALLDADIAAPASAPTKAAKKAGRAGDISVLSSGVLVTSGDYAVGILAHSGNFGSVLTATNQGYVSSWSEASDDNRSTGSGAVSIQATGSIATGGRGAHGIHVLSNGFSANAVGVTIGAATGTPDFAGTIIRTSGAGASALRIDNVGAFAGAAEPSSSTVSVNANVTSDALLDLRRNGHAAIAIDIANAAYQSALTIGGRVLSGDASGLDPARAAIRFESAGQITIQQSATVAGAVTGPQPATGKLADLTIAGTLRGTVSGIVGYTLAQGGTHEAPVDFTPKRVVVDVGSVAVAAGAFRPFLTRFGIVPTAADQSYVLLRTSDASAASVNVRNSLVTTYVADNVSTGASTSVILRSATVSFSKAPIDGRLLVPAGLADKAVTRWTNGAAIAAADVPLYDNLLAAANAFTPGEVSKPLKALDTTAYQDVPTKHAAAGGRHVGTMLSCGVGDGNYAAIREGDCAWASATGAFAKSFSQQNTASDLGLVLGRQYALSDNWRAGIGGGYDVTSTRGSALTGDGHRLHLGATLKYTQGPWLAALALSGSYGWETAKRPIDLPTGPLLAVSERHAASAVARLRLARLFSVGQLDVTTMLDLDANYLHSLGFSERNAGAWDMTAKSSDTFVLGIHPSIRLGYDLRYSDDIVVRTFVEGGLRVNATQGSSSISFRESAILTDIIVVDHQVDRLVGTFGGGVSIFSKDNVETKLVYSGAASKGSISHGGLLKVGLSF